MRRGIIFCNQPNSLDYYAKADEVVNGELFWQGDPGDWATIGAAYKGVHPQRHWLNHNCQQVPGLPGTWQYWTNPIKLTNRHSKEWRVPGRPDLYDICNPDYQDAVIASAIRRAKHASKYHGAFITGLFWDSLTSGWWWGGECPHDPEEYKAAQVEFCRKTRAACHSERMECGGNAAWATVDWPGSLDFVWLEHCTINAEVQSVISDPARKFRVGINIEFIDGRDYTAQWNTLLGRYTPVMRPTDCIMVNDCDKHQAAMRKLMEGILC